MQLPSISWQLGENCTCWIGGGEFGLLNEDECIMQMNCSEGDSDGEGDDEGEDDGGDDNDGEGRREVINLRCGIDGADY